MERITKLDHYTLWLSILADNLELLTKANNPIVFGDDNHLHTLYSIGLSPMSAAKQLIKLSNGKLKG